MQIRLMQMVLWGAAGHALVLEELFSREGVRIAALFDNDPERRSPIDGVPLFCGEAGFREWLDGNDPAAFAGLAAIGGCRGADRLKIHEIFRAGGIRVVSAIHERAFVARTAQLGEGAQVLANAAIGARAILGRAVIVNTGAGVDHECVLEDGVHIGPGATLAGCVTVGRNAFVGAGATVLPGVRIGEESVVGAGAVVTQDVPPRSVAAGVPARILRAV